MTRLSHKWTDHVNLYCNYGIASNIVGNAYNYKLRVLYTAAAPSIEYAENIGTEELKEV